MIETFSIKEEKFIDDIYYLTLNVSFNKKFYQDEYKQDGGFTTDLPNANALKSFIANNFDNSASVTYIKINDPDGYTNVRAGKSSSSEILYQIYDENKLFQLLDDTENWWKIKLNSKDNDWKYGFIYHTKVIKFESFIVNADKVYFYPETDEFNPSEFYSVKGDKLLCNSSIEDGFRNCMHIISKQDTIYSYIIANQLKK